MTNNRLSKLELEIEQLREQLNKIGKELSLSNEEVIRISHKLDTLMNEYEQLK